MEKESTELLLKEILERLKKVEETAIAVPHNITLTEPNGQQINLNTNSLSFERLLDYALWLRKEIQLNPNKSIPSYVG